ncbi:hypothetical protein CYMTET_22750 [Cymbomonas tetramitiformis]|uniref:Secreted protein n=1 Tax=Cymbomonas tetramitiformis TaxID=36881 RepID=A0AAE0FZL0_9CHLO|nr:hypothetical protein CYMTET_22750 [Cymbomonas tetramitiformis]
MLRMKISALILFATLMSVCHAGKRVPPECEGQECPEDYPIMSYNGTCFCEINPCVEMTCNEMENTPVLDFAYDKDGNLDCFCRDPCEEMNCDDPDFPELSWDQEGSCYCRPYRHEEL